MAHEHEGNMVNEFDFDDPDSLHEANKKLRLRLADADARAKTLANMLREILISGEIPYCESSPLVSRAKEVIRECENARAIIYEVMAVGGVCGLTKGDAPPKNGDVVTIKILNSEGVETEEVVSVVSVLRAIMP